MENIYRAICDAVDDQFEALRALSIYIHDHPERAFEETLACAAMTDFLETQGYNDSPRAGGL